MNFFFQFGNLFYSLKNVVSTNHQRNFSKLSRCLQCSADYRCENITHISRDLKGFSRKAGRQLLSPASSYERESSIECGHNLFWAEIKVLDACTTSQLKREDNQRIRILVKLRPIYERAKSSLSSLPRDRKQNQCSRCTEVVKNFILKPIN